MDILGRNWFTQISPDDAKMLAGEKDENGETVEIDGGQELSAAWTGQAFSLHVDQLLFRGRSKYQDIVVFKSKAAGTVLAIDNVIQYSDKFDEGYREMVTHLPMFSHPHPRKVLLIGAGDGLVLRETLKHQMVEQIVMCEIDAMVIAVARKYLDDMECFKSPKLRLIIGDGFEFLKKCANHQFDVIIMDSTDPYGPSKSLYNRTFYSFLRNALTSNGVYGCIAQSIWQHRPTIGQMIDDAQKCFASVAFASSSLPTFPTGSVGILVASKRKQDLTSPLRSLDDDEFRAMRLKMYNKRLHRAVFVLPNFAQDIVDKCQCSQENGTTRKEWELSSENNIDANYSTFIF